MKMEMSFRLCMHVAIVCVCVWWGKDIACTHMPPNVRTNLAVVQCCEVYS